MDDRQAQLVAAAQVLRTWVLAQRDSWPDPPPVVTTTPPPQQTRAPAIGKVESIERVEPVERVEPAKRVEPVERTESVENRTVELADVVARKPASRRSSIPSITTLPAEDSGAFVGREHRARALWRNVSRLPIGRWAVFATMALVVVALAGILVSAGWRARARWLKPAAPPKVGTVVLESVPTGSDVFVDGAPAGRTPLTTELKVGRHVVEFRRRNSSRKLNVDVAAGQSTRERLDWTAKRKGSLEILTDPDGASVSVDGVARGVTPLTIDDLTAGSHEVVLESSSGSLRRTVTVAADRVAQITEAIYSGWLHVSSPIELQVTEGTRGIRLDERGQTLLTPGVHDLQFDNAVFGFRERHRVEIKPGAIASVSITPSPSLLTVNASLPAEVLVDGKRAGETPLMDYPMDLGTRSVVVKSITGAERRFTITTTVKPVSLAVDFSKP